MLTELLRMLEGLLGDRGQASEALAAVAARGGDGVGEKASPMAFTTEADEGGEADLPTDGMGEPMVDTTGAEDQAAGEMYDGEKDDGSEDGSDGDGQECGADSATGDDTDGERTAMQESDDGDGDMLDFIASFLDAGDEGGERGSVTGEAVDDVPEAAGPGETGGEGAGEIGGDGVPEGNGSGETGVETAEDGPAETGASNENGPEIVTGGDGPGETGEGTPESTGPGETGSETDGMGETGGDGGEPVAGLPLIPVEDGSGAMFCDQQDDDTEGLLDMA